MSRPALRIEYPLARDLERAVRDARLTNAHVARKWTDDLLRKHGLETVDVPEGDTLSWGTVPTPTGHVLVVSPVAERTRDAVGDEPLVPLPNGTRLEELGWLVDGVPWNAPAEETYQAVLGDDLPRPARALVTAWWDEVQAAGEVQLPAVEWDDLRPTRGGGLFSLLGPALYPLDTALEYASRLERAALDLRARVEQARADDGTRDADYADALERLAVVERAEGKYDTDTTDHAVTRVAGIIRTGRARMTSAADAGLEGEGWALTTKPAPEPDGEE